MFNDPLEDTEMTLAVRSGGLEIGSLFNDPLEDTEIKTGLAACVAQT